MSLHSQFLPASHSQLAIWHQSDGSGVCFSAPWLTHWLKIFLKGIPERMLAPGTKWACPTPGAEEGCLFALIGQRHHSLNPHRPSTRGPRWSSSLTNANTHTYPPSTLPMSIKGTPLDVLQRPWLVLKIMSEKTLWAQVLESWLLLCPQAKGAGTRVGCVRYITSAMESGIDYKLHE